jgi:hypothetical protein
VVSRSRPCARIANPLLEARLARAAHRVVPASVRPTLPLTEPNPANVTGSCLAKPRDPYRRRMAAGHEVSNQLGLLEWGGRSWWSRRPGQPVRCGA